MIWTQVWQVVARKSRSNELIFINKHNVKYYRIQKCPHRLHIEFEWKMLNVTLYIGSVTKQEMLKGKSIDTVKEEHV